jgi:hypothetical protein
MIAPSYSQAGLGLVTRLLAYGTGIFIGHLLGLKAPKKKPQSRR